jgi:hypothetical protein
MVLMLPQETGLKVSARLPMKRLFLELILFLKMLKYGLSISEPYPRPVIVRRVPEGLR